MTEDAQKPKCDVDDIVCQLGVLSHLREMQSSLGTESFKAKFPQFDGWDQKLVDTISSQEAELGETLKGCGLASAEELTEIRVKAHAVIEPVQVNSEEEAPEE